VATATDFAHRLGGPVAILHKQRSSGTEAAVTHVVGDVRDRPCLIIDDMISTGGTIARAVESLLRAGARPEIVVAATHGLFVGNAWVALGHRAIREIFVTDSMAPVLPDSRLRVVGIAPLIAAAIRQMFAGGSLGELYRDVPRPHSGEPT
jgi:ribose-phosphate pyrophosphokinase